MLQHGDEFCVTEQCTNVALLRETLPTRSPTAGCPPEQQVVQPNRNKGDPLGSFHPH